MKYLTGYSAEGWRAYALRMAAYGVQLRKAGLPVDHPERKRAREGVQRAIREIKREQRHVDAGRRLIAVVGKRKALGTVQAWGRRQ